MALLSSNSRGRRSKRKAPSCDSGRINGISYQRYGHNSKDQMYVLFLLDNESKAKAYGAFGHHQTLDKNVPFKVSRYAGQTATNLMNLNTLLMQTELV